MSLVESAQLHALEVRNRLRRPPNAVQDRAINLKFKNGIDPNRKIISIPIKTVHNEQENNNSLKINTLEDKITALEAQLFDLTNKLRTANIINFEETIEASPIRYLSVGEITKIVCKFFLASVTEIRSHRRTKETARIRFIIIWLCKKHTLRSYPEIGRMLGGRDHSTCCRGWQIIEAERHINSDLAIQLDQLSALIVEASAQQPH